MSGIGTPLEILFAFVLMLGVLVTVHEWGHFIVAKLCGVRVLKFSIGFGPPIGIGRFRMAWHRSGTDYVIGWIPLGGFVKMLGENPDETDTPESRAHPDETLPSKPTWQKLAIVFAGPAMNLILPIVVFVGILWVGVDRRGPVVGTVEPGSPAAEAGIAVGDRLVSMDGEPVGFFDDVERAARERPGETLRLEIERGDAVRSVDVTVEGRPGLDVFQANQEVGFLGIQHTRQQAVVGVPDADSAAGRAGLQTGDRVVAVGGEPVEDWAELAAAYSAQTGPVAFSVERGDEEAPQTVPLEAPALGSLTELGLIPAVVLVAAISDDMPAQRAGLEPGDLIIAVAGEPIGSFATFREMVLASEGRPLEILFGRDGETRTVSLAAQRAPSPTPGVEDEVFLIGIQGANAVLQGAIARDRVRNPLESVPRAVGMTVELTTLYLGGLKRIVSGEISRKNIGGPIEIAKQSHMALQAGWDRFLNLLVLISINLGILNLLPIPILDGGQAVLYAVEGIKRRPLSLRTRELVQQVGLVLIMALMGFAFWNDFSRHWSSFVDWMKGL